MKLIFILMLAVLIGHRPTIAQDTRIYFGSYCLENEENKWDLSLKNRIIKLKCREINQEYLFRYNKCEDSGGSLRICSTDDNLVTLTFFELKEILTCEGPREEHFSKILFQRGKNTSDEGQVCCEN